MAVNTQNRCIQIVRHDNCMHRIAEGGRVHTKYETPQYKSLKINSSQRTTLSRLYLARHVVRGEVEIQIVEMIHYKNERKRYLVG